MAKLKLKYNNSTYSITDDSIRDAEISAIVDVNGCCNVLPNDAIVGSSTSHNVTFTVNNDKTVDFVVNSTPDENGYIQLAWAIKFSSTQLKFYGLPNIEGCYAHLYDKTALRFIWMEENDTIITVDPNHTYDVYLDILTSVPVGTTGTYYPMLYDARLNPSGYVPYTMTNRELAKKQMKSLSSYVDLTTDADGDAYSDTLSSLYPDKVVMGCIIDYNYYKPYAPTRAGYTFYFGDRINIRGGSSQPNMEFRVHYTLLYHDRY